MAKLIYICICIYNPKKEHLLTDYASKTPSILRKRPRLFGGSAMKMEKRTQIDFFQPGRSLKVCSILLRTGERDLANYLINALLWQRQTGEYFEFWGPRPCCSQTELCINATEFGIFTDNLTS